MQELIDLSPAHEPNGDTPFGFFAYPSTPPMLPPTIRAAIEGINKTDQTLILGWEELAITGRFIIGEITKNIDQCDFLCADITGINPNVLFEIGYAIARNKRIWLIRDGSYTDSKKDFDQLKLLTTLGFTPYTNSGHIITTFFKERPHLDTNGTVFIARLSRSSDRGTKTPPYSTLRTP